jgi:REP element-mobilizing transposase RayT
MLLSIPPAISVSEALRTVKANSSRWSRQERLLSSDFSWQKGYGIFTVSYSQRNLVAEYIRNQPEHHRCKTFAEEYMSILKKHGLSFDPAHLFEQEHYG